MDKKTDRQIDKKAIRQKIATGETSQAITSFHFFGYFYSFGFYYEITLITARYLFPFITQ